MKFLPAEFLAMCVSVAILEMRFNKTVTTEKLALYAVAVVVIVSFLLIGRISQEYRRH